ncbi:MAG: TetR/AcrR family transcriptional regulator [Pseudomonadota bacterium]
MVKKNPAPRTTAKPGSSPPGRIKIAEALKTLLKHKEFSAITWADIAATAGVNEALIYKYFQDKRGLLHQVLEELMKIYIDLVREDLAGRGDSLEKLGRVMEIHIREYDRDRVFARILLLEVRNFPGYFQSDTYGLVREYGRMVLEIIEQGIAAGELRPDLNAKAARQIIMGTIEHLCLPYVLYDREMPVAELAGEARRIVLPGLKKI